MSTGNWSGTDPNGIQGSTIGQETHSDASESDSSGVSGVVHDAQEALKDTASQTLDSAKQTAQDITAQTKDQVGDVVSETVDQASQAISDVKEQAVSSYTAQRDRAVEMLTGLAEALKSTGQNLAGDAPGKAQDHNSAMALAPFIDEAADRLNQSANFLRDKDMSSLMREAQTMARKQPLLFLGAMFGVGVAGARMFKGMNDSSSAQSDSDDSMLTSGTENDNTEDMNQTAQHRHDWMTDRADGGSRWLSAPEHQGKGPDAMKGLDDSPADMGEDSDRPTEKRS